MSETIEVMDKFLRRSGGLDIAVVQFLSVDGTVGYRLKGSRRIRTCSEKTFLRTWKPLLDKPDLPDLEPNREQHQ